MTGAVGKIDARVRRAEMLRTVLAWLVALVFLYAAKQKIADPAEFAQDIKYYKILPLGLVNGFALLLPAWELAAGLALLTPAWRRAGASMILVLLVLFLIAISTAVVRSLDISCGCFGHSSHKAGYQALGLDIALLAATGLVLWYRPRPKPAPALVRS